MPFARAEVPGMSQQSSGCSCSVDTGLWVDLYHEIYDDVEKEMRETGSPFHENLAKQEASKRLMLRVIVPDVRAIRSERSGKAVIEYEDEYKITDQGLMVNWNGKVVSAEQLFVSKRRSMGREDPDETRTFYSAQEKILASSHAEVWFPVHHKVDGEDHIRYAAHWVRDGSRVLAEMHRIGGEDRGLSLREARQVIQEKVRSYAPHETHETDASSVLSNIPVVDHGGETRQAQHEHNQKTQKEVFLDSNNDRKPIPAENIIHADHRAKTGFAEHQVIRDATDTLVQSAYSIKKDIRSTARSLAHYLQETTGIRRKTAFQKNRKEHQGDTHVQAKEKQRSPFFQKLEPFLRPFQFKKQRTVKERNTSPLQRERHLRIKINTRGIVSLRNAVSELLLWPVSIIGMFQGEVERHMTQSMEKKGKQWKREAISVRWFMKLFKRGHNKQPAHEHGNITERVQPLKAEKLVAEKKRLVERISPFYTMLHALAAKLRMFPGVLDRYGAESVTQHAKKKQDLPSEGVLPDDNRLDRETPIYFFETINSFFFAAILWYVLHEADAINTDTQSLYHVDEKHMDVPVRQYKTEKLEQSATGGNWILFSIIWYLAMIREQGLKQVYSSQFTVQRKKGKKIKSDFRLPSQGVIFAFRS